MEGIVIRRQAFDHLKEMIMVALLEGARDMDGKVPYLSYDDMQANLEKATREALALVCPYPFKGVNDEIEGYSLATEYKGRPTFTEAKRKGEI